MVDREIRRESDAKLNQGLRMQNIACSFDWRNAGLPDYSYSRSPTSVKDTVQRIRGNRFSIFEEGELSDNSISNVL